MRRARTRSGLDAVHRSEAAVAVDVAGARLRRFASAATCRDRASALRAAARALAEANAQQLSIEARAPEDRRLAERLGALNSVYQRAWERFRKRCTRG